MSNRMIDVVARYKGLPTLVGMLLILVNLIFQFVPGLGWLASSNLLLHLGLLLALTGILMARAL